MILLRFLLSNVNERDVCSAVTSFKCCLARKRFHLITVLIIYVASLFAKVGSDAHAFVAMLKGGPP